MRGLGFAAGMVFGIIAASVIGFCAGEECGYRRGYVDGQFARQVGE